MISLDARDLAALIGAVALLVGAYMVAPAYMLIALGVLIILTSIFIEVGQPTRGTDGPNQKHS